jgi:signal transduction histidine kinase
VDRQVVRQEEAKSPGPQDREAVAAASVAFMTPGRPRPTRGEQLRPDALLAALLLAAEIALLVLGPHRYWPHLWWLSVPWLGLAYVSVALRRVQPWLAIVLIVAHTVVSMLAHPSLPTGGVPIIVITYTAASRMPVRRALGATVLLWVPALVLGLLGSTYAQDSLDLSPGYFVLGNLMAALVCFFVGRTVFNRRAYVAALEDRAHTAELNQRTMAEQAVAEERRRIARELHDVVAHHVSVMSVLATGSRRALRSDPAAADEALATIEETGRVALREMRRMLSVLRTDAEPAGELEPQPDLPGLESLLEQIRDAGLPVTLLVSGEPGLLDPGVALTVYRITQEALTNSLKHAGPASAEVRLDFTAKELTIDICDTGRGPHPGTDYLGHGLLGMRERISLYGGSLRTGPRPGGGFRVTARIPVDVAGNLS